MSNNVTQFEGATIADALRAVRTALGPDAVILGTRHIGSSRLGTRVARVEITATNRPVDPVRRPRATQTETPTTTRVPRAQLAAFSTEGDAFSGEIEPFVRQLVRQDISNQLARTIVARALRRAPTGRLTRDTLREEIARTLGEIASADSRVDLHGTHRRIAFIGPGGAGKTSTIAKLAARFRLKDKLSVGLLSLDHTCSSRAKLIERYSELIGVTCRCAQTVGAVKDAMREMAGHDVVLIDTYGVGQRDRAHFVRLAALVRATRPDETHLVIPASMAAGARDRIRAQFEPFSPSRLILTRLDEMEGVGVVLEAAVQLHLGVSYLTDGQNVPSDLKESCPEQIARLLLD